MKIKILIFLIFVSFFQITKASNVEDIFSDINKSYTYYTELQTLYDKGMISPDSDGKFNPYSLIKRDDFVGITMEVNCRKCIQPNTPSTLILKYSSILPFFDVVQTNKNFYCISDGKENDYVVGYNNSYVCTDGTTKSGESPFCVNNNITREEALAIMLRKSSIFSLQDSDNIINQIKAGIITENLANDIKAKNSDGSPYTFYGYFKKALEYSLVEYDTAGNKKEYKLLEKDSAGNLNPKKAITKEEFLKWAYILFKANSCNPVIYKQINLALDFDILDKSCNKTKSCSRSDLKNTKETTYDFKALVGGACSLGIDESSYIRQLYNTDTKSRDIVYGPYIDNYVFKDIGHRKITLIVTDKCGNKGISSSNLLVTNTKDTNLSVDIEANPIIGNANLKVDFNSIISKSDNLNCTYTWNFGDGNNAFGEDTEHIYTAVGVYEARLDVVCEDGEKGSSQVMIKVEDFKTCDSNNLCQNGYTCSDKGFCIKNSDNDLLSDDLDKCPLVYGDIKNNGCPIITYKSSDIAQTSCLLPSNGSSIFGNIICSSCPCNYNLDFIASLRKCDNVFPAIISPDKSTIYSKGNNWLIK